MKSFFGSIQSQFLGDGALNAGLDLGRSPSSVFYMDG
jgi:hypothetical protein